MKHPTFYYIKQKKYVKETYIRYCKRCNKIYKPKAKHSDICPDCNLNNIKNKERLKRLEKNKKKNDKKQTS